MVVGEDERVVGCYVIGEMVDGVLQGFAVAITQGREANRDITISYLINAEELVTMRRSMGDVLKR